jgi:hypothetical protein
MSQVDTLTRYVPELPTTPFVDRRKRNDHVGSQERRQFGNSYRELPPDAQELAEAIDAYKLRGRRRYITAEELLSVVKGLGYRRDA